LLHLPNQFLRACTTINNSSEYADVSLDVSEASGIYGDESYGLREKFGNCIGSKGDGADQHGRFEPHYFVDIHLPTIAHVRKAAHVSNVFAPFTDANELASRA
jgi:hypothetical protein